MAPALACGNTIVLKPPHQTPHSTLHLTHLLSTTSIPQGVINVLPGDAQTGAALVTNPLIDKISFTGSTAVGSVIARQAASSPTGPKPCTMELGGKAPMIVCDDADLERAVDDVVGAAFSNAGQNCCAGTRLYLQEGVHDEFLRLLKGKVEALVVGDHLEEETDMGPLVNENQMDKILHHIETAKKQNVGNLLTGGHRLGESGYFVAPTGKIHIAEEGLPAKTIYFSAFHTVFYDVSDTAQIAQEEIFGPVLTVLKPFKTIEEAIERANASQYGLAAGIWSENRRTLDMASKGIRAGIVWMNCYNMTPPSIPVGGRKGSGYGKDQGFEAVDQYTFVKAVMSRT
ncbi:Aldehyde dehydrogenase 2 member C4 [Rhizophlyctis rosea]|uniref:Aldehyde dehydrogenase 2 member C4 n=1 Tax=Rhizophlyctis rosea TaxID=64517 RepID=A0AAD5X0J9_9FUNG|nr:Aldehyde dehydrogenase 2 member C4 [Rhizophlyctis rosea]